ncbi:hypothetical protein LJR030_001440 [Rhizobium sp. LjRoot30]|uniref:hypothetical protein n=1 Tax=Rhizobium sp. LjRoot30 TaxID=3342320 RepID=UPI003ECF6C72
MASPSMPNCTIYWNMQFECQKGLKLGLDEKVEIEAMSFSGVSDAVLWGFQSLFRKLLLFAGETAQAKLTMRRMTLSKRYCLIISLSDFTVPVSRACSSGIARIDPTMTTSIASIIVRNFVSFALLRRVVGLAEADLGGTGNAC